MSFKIIISYRIYRAIWIPYKDRVKLYKISDKDIDRYCAIDISKDKAKAIEVNKIIDCFIDQLSQKIVISSKDKDSDNNKNYNTNNNNNNKDNKLEINKAIIWQQITKLGLDPITLSYINSDRLFSKKIVDLLAPVLSSLLYIPFYSLLFNNPIFNNAAPLQNTTPPKNILEDSIFSNILTINLLEDKLVTHQKPLTNINHQIERETQKYQASQYIAIKRKHNRKQNIVIFKKGDFVLLVIPKDDCTSLDNQQIDIKIIYILKNNLYIL